MAETSTPHLGGDSKRTGWHALPLSEKPDDDPAEHEVEGSVIFFDPDEEDSWVLRDASGSLPPEALDLLGLTKALQAELRQWHHRWSAALASGYRLDAQEFRALQEQLHAEAVGLVTRVEGEMRDGYTVELQLEPWPELPDVPDSV